MIKTIEESPLFQVANPKSVAFFGASNNYRAMGSAQMASFKALGFEGSVYPVHPREKEVQGFKAYQHVGDLPEVPDLAVMTLPTSAVCQVLAECGEKGIKHAIVVSGGFKEVGEQGIELQDELKKTVLKYGIRLVGPNCLGVANPHHKLNPTPLRYMGKPGFIGIASQSGSFVTQMFDYLNQMGLGFSTAFSVGNELDLDLVDCLEYLGACDKTKVIALYVEGIRRGKEFIEMAKAIVPHKPIVALYIGGTEAGRRAGFSHTAAMSGPDELYEGIFRQSGVIRAASILELFDFCWALGSLPLPKGTGTIIQSHSGGPAATAADAAGRAGLTLSALSRDTLDKLSPLVPHTASINNPVDLTFTKNPLDFFGKIPEILIEDAAADNLLIYFLMPESIVTRIMKEMGVPEEKAMEDADQLLKNLSEAIINLKKKYGKPVMGFTFRSLTERLPKELIRGGIPVFQGPERAVAAIGALLRYKAITEQFSA
jgi:acetyl-CoA synthetase (ADP-forming)